MRKLETAPNIEVLPPEALMTRAQVASLSGFTTQAIKKWAKQGRGPAVTVVEGRPRYKVRDVRRWLSGRSPTRPDKATGAAGIFG